MKSDNEVQLGLDLLKVLEDPSVSSVYANGFVVYRSNSDVGVILRLDNRAVVKLHLSYTLAKSLSVGLAETIGDIEKITEQTILTTVDIEKSFKGQKDDQH